MSQKNVLISKWCIGTGLPTRCLFLFFFNKTGKIKTESAFSSIPIVFHLVCKQYAKPGLHHVL